MFRPPHRAEPSPLLRNLAAILIAFSAVSVLYFGFDGQSADAGLEKDDERLIARLTAAASGPAVSTAASAEGGEDGTTAPLVLEGAEALQRNLELLEEALEKLSRVPDYTATMFTQERVGGEMNVPHVIELKLRHEPFSLYMKWLAGDDKGRELIYVDGQNNGEMLVKLGGLKGRLLPAINVDPHGALALSKSRHAITEAGLLNLVRTLLEHRRKDCESGTPIDCRMSGGHEFDGRPCCCFELNFIDRERSKTYRKSVQYFDEQLRVPVCIKNYGWPPRETIPAEKLDDATIVEHYSYSDLRFSQRLTDRDFDRTNARYAFR